MREIASYPFDSVAGLYFVHATISRKGFPHMPLTGTGFRWYESDEIDGASTGTHLLSTTVTEESFSRIFMPFGAVVVMTDVDNLLTPALISVGKVPSAYNDIVAASLVGTVLGKIKLFSLAGDLELVDEGTDIKVKVVAAATALLGAPTCKFKVIVFGRDIVASD